MPIVLDFVRSVQALVATILKSGDVPRQRCRDCDVDCWRHGQYERWVSERDRDHPIKVYRQRCPRCGKTFGVLPAFLRPHARHLTLLREVVVRSRARGETLEQTYRRVNGERGGISRRTIQRWWAQTRRRAAAVSDALGTVMVDLDPSVNPIDEAATTPGANVVAILLRLGLRFRRQFWARSRDRRAWAVGLFGLCNAQGWAKPML